MLENLYQNLNHGKRSIAYVELKVVDERYIPKYAKSGDAGADLRARLDNPVTIMPSERRIIPTGCFMAIPEGMEFQIRPTSGNAYKRGITVLNTPGTIDSGYRGEVGVILINLGDSPITINDCDKIAQGVLTPYIGANWVLTNELNQTERGEGGFGHTGIVGGGNYE
jgi:dUTP pyrophosphatase